MKKRISHFLDDHTDWFCWGGLVLWFMGDITFIHLLKNYQSGGCKIDRDEDGACYCGKFTTQEFRKQFDTNMEKSKKLPF